MSTKIDGAAPITDFGFRDEYGGDFTQVGGVLVNRRPTLTHASQ